MTPDADVLVVGGGPVGLASAIEARLAGLSVVVVEPRGTPIDKACGEGLMPGALAALHRLGVDPDGRTLTGIRYVRGDRVADHLFRTGAGRGVRRTTLHAALARRGQELGVQVVRARATGVEQADGTVVAAGVRARWLLACDGLHSAVRRQNGLEDAPVAAARRRFGLRRHFGLAPWSDLVEVHWARDVEAYVTPVADDVVGVALLGPARTSFERVLDELPRLRDRLAGARVLGPTLGAGPLRQRTLGRTAGRVRLVGDASGYVDALTGEGLRVGLAQARAAVATLGPGGHGDVGSSDEAYERAWVSATRDYRVITSGLVSAAGSPLRGAIVPLAAALPAVYGAIVERLAR